MSWIPLLLAAVLLILAIAFGFHCLVLHCDRTRTIEPARDPDSATRRSAH
ncbi:MAG: hypothetical protein JNL90_14575 [Planctomycetes bacterium]|nr:hypothetical protein [Planctomycetota bacterium]